MLMFLIIYQIENTVKKIIALMLILNFLLIVLSSKLYINFLLIILTLILITKICIVINVFMFLASMQKNQQLLQSIAMNPIILKN